ncbi:MAG: hypothetical protein AAB074_23590 [Planctomycetota bacterium]
MKFVLGFVFLALTAGLGFSAKAISDLRKQQSDLENRIIALSERPAAPTPETASGSGSSSSSTPASPGGTDSVAPAGSASGSDSSDNGAVARKPVSGGTPAVGSTVNPSSWTEADKAAFESEVLAVLEKQEKEREEKRDARQSEWMTARLKEQLKLTDQQAAEIGKIVTATQAEIEKIRATMTPENREEIRPQIQAALATADTQVKAYLTAEQVTAYDEMKKNGNLNLGGWGGGGGSGGNGRRRMQGEGGAPQPQ